MNASNVMRKTFEGFQISVSSHAQYQMAVIVTPCIFIGKYYESFPFSSFETKYPGVIYE